MFLYLLPPGGRTLAGTVMREAAAWQQDCTHTVRHRRARPEGRASDSVDATHAEMSRSFHDSRIVIAQAKQVQVSGKFNGSSSRFTEVPGNFLPPGPLGEELSTCDLAGSSRVL
jgi:hypothetical protein